MESIASTQVTGARVTGVAPAVRQRGNERARVAHPDVQHGHGGISLMPRDVALEQEQGQCAGLARREPDAPVERLWAAIARDRARREGLHVRAELVLEHRRPHACAGVDNPVALRIGDPGVLLLSWRRPGWARGDPRRRAQALEARHDLRLELADGDHRTTVRPHVNAGRAGPVLSFPRARVDRVDAVLDEGGCCHARRAGR